MPQGPLQYARNQNMPANVAAVISILAVIMACMVQVPMEEARKKELDFFKGSRHYSDLKNVGTGFLSTKLSTHLINAIRKQLPIIQHSINDGIINLDRELEALGGPAVTTRGAMVHLILQVISPAREIFGHLAASRLTLLVIQPR